MIRPALKTVRVESAHFPDGVLINAESFNPESDVLWDRPRPEAKPVSVDEKPPAK